MNGVHDLGGTDGLGPVEVPEKEPVFRADWERAAFAMFSMPFRAGFFGVDMFRYGIEQIPPAVYLNSPYYEHWLHTAEHWGLEKGVLDADEIDKRAAYYLENPDAPLPEREDPDLLAFVDAAVKSGVPAGRPSDNVAKFAVGDTVTVIDDSVRSGPWCRGRRSCRPYRRCRDRLAAWPWPTRGRVSGRGPSCGLLAIDGDEVGDPGYHPPDLRAVG